MCNKSSAYVVWLPGSDREILAKSNELRAKGILEYHSTPETVNCCIHHMSYHTLQIMGTIVGIQKIRPRWAEPLELRHVVSYSTTLLFSRRPRAWASTELITTVLYSTVPHKFWIIIIYDRHTSQAQAYWLFLQ